LRLKLKNNIQAEFSHVFLWDGPLAITIQLVVEVESGYVGTKLFGLVLRLQNQVNTLLSITKKGGFQGVISVIYGENWQSQRKAWWSELNSIAGAYHHLP